MLWIGRYNLRNKVQSSGDFFLLIRSSTFKFTAREDAIQEGISFGKSD